MSANETMHDSFSLAFARLIDETNLPGVTDYEAQPGSIDQEGHHPAPSTGASASRNGQSAWEEELAPNAEDSDLSVDSPILCIDSFAKWSEPIRYLSAAWQPVITDLIQARTNESEAAERMHRILREWLTERPGMTVGRASALSLSIPRMLALHRSLSARAAEAAERNEPAHDLLQKMREERRRNALRPSGQSAGIYVSFANLVHDAHIQFHARSLRDASA